MVMMRDDPIRGVALLARRTDSMDASRLQSAFDLLKCHPRVGEIVETTDRERIAEVADRVVVAAGTVRPDLLRNMPRLEWYQQWGAGADWLKRHPWAQEAPFVLTNTSGIHPIQIGEHVFATLLGLVRRLPDSIRAQQEREWFNPSDESMGELAGSRMLVCGYGAIGQRIAELARAFGMTVDVISRTGPDASPGIERVGRQSDLTVFLADADAVVVTVPLTGETEHMFGSRAFAVMKPTAWLVNIGRGGVVDEAALLAALRSGELAGAALDVFQEEPLPTDSPLWGAPNLLITGHYAGATSEYDARALAVFRDNIERFVSGEPLVNVVDKRKGY